MKNLALNRFIPMLAIVVTTISMAACSAGAPKQTFLEAHNSFQTNLVKQEQNSDEIPVPPEGLLDLVNYPSKAGDLAAYISSDPGDGQKHPLIIWAVGGWGNSIDEFPWSYAPWDDDQSASAFWKSGVLTMYPSFRGGNGNPGYYETLFGEVDDLVSAYEYAKTLPYVDANRIYLGGHSTGGTLALLTAAYTDQFRGVFCFGPTDKIQAYNTGDFNFDTKNRKEFLLRSPIYWLNDVKTPTFIIEGMDGNSRNLKNIQNKSKNQQINCYIVEGADHFSILAPVTELLAQKILSDTGETSNIIITQEELQVAMAQPPKEPVPVMSQYNHEELGFAFSYPYIWNIQDTSNEDGFQLSLQSKAEGDNIWDMSTLYIDVFTSEEPELIQKYRQYLESNGYTVKDTVFSEYPSFEADGNQKNDNGSSFRHKILFIPKEDRYLEFNFYIHDSYGTAADPLFQKILDSITLTPFT